MININSPGIILKNSPLLTGARLLIILTREYGILRCLSNKNLNDNTFSLIEFILKKSKSSLYRIVDFSILNSNSILRERYDLLKSACEICNILLKSQLPEKPSHQLYDLALAYLLNLHKVENQNVLISSFYLKFLKTEGILNEDFNFFSETEKIILKNLLNIRNFSEFSNFAKESNLALKEKIFKCERGDSNP